MMTLSFLKVIFLGNAVLFYPLDAALLVSGDNLHEWRARSKEEHVKLRLLGVSLISTMLLLYLYLASQHTLNKHLYSVLRNV